MSYVIVPFGKGAMAQGQIKTDQARDLNQPCRTSSAKPRKKVMAKKKKAKKKTKS
jgi:hypothetical protein